MFFSGILEWGHFRSRKHGTCGTRGQSQADDTLGQGGSGPRADYILR